MCLGMILLGRFFGLHVIPQVILLASGMVLLPFLVRNAYRNRYYQQKFSDLNVYMEQFLYSFQNTRKVLTTLEDTAELFDEGEMKETIAEARDHILYTYKSNYNKYWSKKCNHTLYSVHEVRSVCTGISHIKRYYYLCNLRWLK